MRILSLCVGMGLLDRAFLDEGFDVVPGCEIDPEQRLLYAQVCGGTPLVERLEDLSDAVRGETFDAVIGGPPCQAHTKLRSMRAPRYGDLTGEVGKILEEAGPGWVILENVRPVEIVELRRVRLNAMHYGQPAQSRARWFSYRGEGLTPPSPLYRGGVDDLMAYPVVAGRIYGPKRGAVLQGWPDAARLEAPCRVVQKGLANAVHYGLARAWAGQLRKISPPS